jgi:AraC-like DNA-binding protein
MSRKRQVEFGVRTFAVTTKMASLLPPQNAEWAQLIYATQGTLTVECPIGERVWYVPARRALWVPAGVTSKLRMRGAVRLRMLYLHASLCAGGQEAQGINVAPLLHEAILEAVRRSVVGLKEPLTGLIAELVVASSDAPLMLPMPLDARALRVAKRLMHDPAKRATLEELAHEAGAGVRTLERLFASETGMGFAAWRQRLRMLESLRLLLDGDSVADAAEAVGYESVSAFVVAFKATMGETPGVLRGRRALGPVTRREAEVTG